MQVGEGEILNRERSQLLWINYSCLFCLPLLGFETDTDSIRYLTANNTGWLAYKVANLGAEVSYTVSYNRLNSV